MKVEEIIRELKKSNLWAEGPCGCEFKLSEAVLFDGAKPFPKEALETKKSLLDALKGREEELKKQKKLTTEKALITTQAVNVGKNLEKILPTLKDFAWSLPDCRFLGDPIDLITFNGLSVNMVHSISFIEVKTGGARLNQHQRFVKEAIENKKISFEVFK